MSPQPLTDADPRQVGPYRLLRRLGEGGMGRVYLGRSPGGRTVAVKLVHAEMLGVPGFRERFAREVRASQTVQGPGTVPVVAADPDAQVPWLASAYVPGPSLAEAVVEYGALPPAALWRLLSGLVQALGTVHAAGLVHRDLKPSNVLLSLDGPHLIDFGIARAADSTEGLTRTGTVIGSPGFMSPEQAEGRQQLTAASDVFSLGGVLAFAATGRGPFGQGTQLELLYRVVHTPPELDELAEPLLSVVRECLDKEPGQRPPLNALYARAASAGGAAAGEGADWLPAQIASAIGRRAAQLLDLESEDGPGPGAGLGVAGTPPPPGMHGQPTQYGQPQPQAQAGGFGPPTPQPYGQPGQFGQPQPQPQQGYGTGPTGAVWQTGGMAPAPGGPQQGGRRTGLMAAIAAGVVLVAGAILIPVLALGGSSDDEASTQGGDPTVADQDPSASASASASVTETDDPRDVPADESEVVPADVVGVWRGSYSCTQGETGLTLTIEEDMAYAGGVTATFEFFPLPDNPVAEEGSYSMVGTLEGGQLDLVGEEWIEQPDDYLMVDLIAEIPEPDPQHIDGAIVSVGSSCDTFAVSRR